MTRQPQFSHDKNVERSVESFGYFEPYRYATSRQREDDHVAPVCKLTKFGRQHPTGFEPILKQHRNRPQKAALD
jgi:hypothetical protein